MPPLADNWQPIADRQSIEFNAARFFPPHVFQVNEVRDATSDQA